MLALGFTSTELTVWSIEEFGAVAVGFVVPVVEKSFLVLILRCVLASLQLAVFVCWSDGNAFYEKH